MEGSSTRITDLPDNITMSSFSEGPQSFNDRASDMASASYRQMNPHQNPFMQGQPSIDAMPPPAAAMRRQANEQQRGFEDPDAGRRNPPKALPPSYDMDRGPLGQAPQFPLPQRDIPMNMEVFRDESAMPNYIPPANPNKEPIHFANAVQKPAEFKFNFLAELQIPIIVSILFCIFQMNAMNTVFSKYFKFAQLFGEDGLLNDRGILFKSALFGGAYYGIMKLLEMAEQ